ncbi:hypothetical protein CPB83DRAFT_893538 [Crepidotus variabilis]|uniref:Uncharacterized protein n=1 Tax=Crepidotus variabilis TaxID=179855 RepID=A0A9P6EH03_9AGAR|nr:hypothetical protein CPB83DRAFT_893538 [Crepidotus variabilis]
MAGAKANRLTVTGTGITPTGMYSGSGSATVTGISDSRVPDSTTFTRTYLRSNSASDFLSSDSPSTLSRAGLLNEELVMDDGEDKENESGSGSVGQFTPSGVSYDSYTPGSGTVSMSGSGSHGSGSYMPVEVTHQVAPTPRVEVTVPVDPTHPVLDTLLVVVLVVAAIHFGRKYLPVAVWVVIPQSHPARLATTFVHLPTSPRYREQSPLTPATSVTLSDIASEKYIGASLASAEYETAAVIQSSRASSICSFQSLQTISDHLSVDDGKSDSSYRTASEPEVGSDYRTALEPDEPASTSAYVSAPTFELPEIPSENQLNRSVLLSLKLGEDDDSENESKRSFTICVGVFGVVTRGNVITAFSTCIVGCYPPAITNSDTITLIGVYQFDVQAAATFRNPIIGKFPAVPKFTYSPARSPAEISRSLASSPSLPPLPLSPSLPSLRSSPPSSHPSTPPTSLPISTLGRTLIVMPMSTVLSSASSLPASTQVVHPTTAALSQSTWSILDFTPAR